MNIIFTKRLIFNYSIIEQFRKCQQNCGELFARSSTGRPRPRPTATAYAKCYSSSRAEQPTGTGKDNKSHNGNLRPTGIVDTGGRSPTGNLQLNEANRIQILAETELSKDHLTPELQLHLITSNCRLWTAHPDESPFGEPFWSFYWPGGQAVSRYLLDNHSLVKGKRILDFGAGCGASGLAAKKSGAACVTFNDIDIYSSEAVRLNGEANKIDVDDVSLSNLIGSCCQRFDVVLVGDMLYDTEFAVEVLEWLSILHQRGKLILVGDPGRFALESHPLRSSLACLAKYELNPSTILENSGHPRAFVWTFR